MSWTNEEQKVLSVYIDSGQISPPRKFIGEYRFRLGNLEPEIIIKLYALFQSTRIQFVQSHFIYTPVQMDAYVTNNSSNDNIVAALDQIIFGFTNFYDSAVKARHKPDDSWLIPNPDF